VPTPTDPHLPDREPSARTGARWTPVDQAPSGWVTDTVPAVPGPGAGAQPAPRATLTAMTTPPHRGGVRRSGPRRGDATLATAWLGSCRCLRHV
jgi:hypothetical protein